MSLKPIPCLVTDIEGEINEISARGLTGGLRGFIPAPLLFAHPSLQNRRSFYYIELSGCLAPGQNMKGCSLCSDYIRLLFLVGSTSHT